MKTPVKTYHSALESAKEQPVFSGRTFCATSRELIACPVCTGYADNSLLWADKAAEAVSLNVEHRSSSIIPLGQNG